MGIDDRTLRRDDSPKTRVLEKFPELACCAVRRNDYSLVGYVIHKNGRGICDAHSAWDAWRTAEAILITEPAYQARALGRLA